MPRSMLFAVALALATLPGALRAQTQQKQDEKFPTNKPAEGDPLPDLAVYATDGKPIRTADLKGQYTVLVFGCLT